MKILFGSVPADGHFHPLTRVAVHLRRQGHDVRWYTGPSYATKLAALDVPHLPYRRAFEVNADNLHEVHPEYERLGVGPKAIAFALEKIFFGNLEAQLRDLCELHGEFPFEAMVYDAGFYAAGVVAEKLGIAGYAVAPAPTPAPSSRQAPPPFFGLHPARSALGRMRDRLVNATHASATKGGMKILATLREAEGLPPFRHGVFDLHAHTARAIFQVGSPSLDFPRDDWPANLEFVGALLPQRGPDRPLPAEVVAAHERCGSLVVVSQGTIDNRDPTKLFVPALEALAGSTHAVVVTTGGRHGDELRARFPQDNVVVADWIDFEPLLARADLFVTNGGFGSVLHALVHGVPILAAGTLEGKNDVNARIAYRDLGLDLRTERPSSRQIARGVAHVMGDPRFRANVGRLRDELARYRPLELIEARLVADARARAA